MCMGERFGTCFSAIALLREAQKSLTREQYQEGLEMLEQAQNEIQKQKGDLRKYLEKELRHKNDPFQKNEENIARPWTLTKTDPLLLTKREPCFAREGIVSEGF